jgi:hypothetical protein
MTRSKETLKREILQVLKDGKKDEIFGVDELKKTLRITSWEADNFSNAVRELENEKQIAMHISVSFSIP